MNESDYPRTYRTSLWWLVPPMGIGFVVLWAKMDVLRAGISLPVLAAIALLVVLPAVFTRVILHPDRIEVRGWGGRSEMLRADMAGWRRYRRRGVSYISFKPNRSDLSSLSVAVRFPRDEAWWAWLKSLPDLDAADRAKAVAD